MTTCMYLSVCVRACVRVCVMEVLCGGERVIGRAWVRCCGVRPPIGINAYFLLLHNNQYISYGNWCLQLRVSKCSHDGYQGTMSGCPYNRKYKKVQDNYKKSIKMISKLYVDV